MEKIWILQEHDVTGIFNGRARPYTTWDKAVAQLAVIHECNGTETTGITHGGTYATISKRVVDEDVWICSTAYLYEFEIHEGAHA